MPAKRIKRRVSERKKVPVADALFGRTKQRVLGLLFGQPDRSFGTVELIGLAGSGRGAVQRELEVLAHAGLIDIEIVGLQKRYHANHSAPVFEDLCRIVEKTSGIAEVLRTALSALGDKVDLAILYGSVAKNEATSQSDVDVLLISEALTLEDAYRALEPAEARIGRRINPTIYSAEEFHARRQSKQSFLAKVLSGPHAVLIGALDGDRSIGSIILSPSESSRPSLLRRPSSMD